MIKTPKLCYIEGGIAYFTTQDPKDQHGDSWEDRPYEFYAGEPYQSIGNYGGLTWEIVKVSFEGPLKTPDQALAEAISIREINEGGVPWLTEVRDGGQQPLIKIFSGTSLAMFKVLIRQAGGEIFESEISNKPETVKVTDQFRNVLKEFKDVELALEEACKRLERGGDFE